MILKQALAKYTVPTGTLVKHEATIAIILERSGGSRLACAGAGLGIAAFVPFWDGQARLLAHEGLIGAALSLILLVIGMAFP